MITGPSRCRKSGSFKPNIHALYKPWLFTWMVYPKHFGCHDISSVYFYFINVFIAFENSFSISGTHWVFEIISMLLNGKAETIPHSKGKLMLEAVPKSELEKCPSPRVLNSHLPLTMLPKDIKGQLNWWGIPCHAP